MIFNANAKPAREGLRCALLFSGTAIEYVLDGGARDRLPQGPRKARVR